jgi:threonyl-tRNA synthetase
MISIQITFPTAASASSSTPFPWPQVAASIGAGLAKATVAGKVDGKLVDASDASTTTPPARSSPRRTRGVEIIRHSCAHLVGMR